MGCQVKKCANSICDVRIRECQMINGKCPQCYQNEQQKIINNVHNQSQVNGQYIKQ